jgi:hypothetical protein
LLNGPTSDMFFLSFDQFGTGMHVHTDPAPAVPVPPSNSPLPDIGIKTFNELNASFSTITGVPVGNTAVSTMYNTLQQSLPPSSDISSFLAANQTAISQLADSYCQQLMSSSASVSAFFGAGVAANLSASGASFFGTTTANLANRHLVVDPLVTAVVGTNVNVTTAQAINQEIAGIDPTTGTQLTNTTVYNDTLITKLASTTDTVSAIVEDSCTAILGSAAASVQ